MTDRPHKYVKYLALSLGYWGRGDTQAEAIKQMRSAGFSGRIGMKKNKVLLYVFPEGAEDPYVDSMGNVNWYATDPNVEPPEPERFQVKHDGTLIPFVVGRAA